MKVIRQTNSHFNESVQLPETATAVFDSSAAKGDVVFSSADGHVDLAQANGEPQTYAIGLATSAVTAGQIGEYLTSGVLDGLAGLTPGTVYYLDPNAPGAITNVYPEASGVFVVIMGIAVSPTALKLHIHFFLEQP